MRVTIFAIVLCGCFPSSSKTADVGSPGDDGADLRDAGVGQNPNGAPCMTADDCTLAGATCCECPSFAVATADHYGECNGVTCPMQPACPVLEARCEQFQCVAACAPVACEMSCADGFAVDAAGCEVCACAPPVQAGCDRDSDCARVGADCCGCARGGMDTAVLASEAAAFHASLGCSQNAQCPEIDTCTPDIAARCVRGACTLSTGTMPEHACGRSDLPLCPTNQQCILNANPDTTALGVGLCGTAP